MHQKKPNHVVSPPRRIRSLDAPYSLARAVEEFKRKYIENVVRLTEGNMDKAAGLLGIAPQKLRDLVEERVPRSQRLQNAELTATSETCAHRAPHMRKGATS